MSNTLGLAISMYADGATNSLFDPSFYKEQLRQKTLVARMVGKTAAESVKGFSLNKIKEDAKTPRGKKGLALLAANSVQYLCDEPLGIASLPAITSVLTEVMPKVPATAGAIGIETVALTGIAYALGMANLHFKQSKDDYVEQKSLPTAVQAGIVTGAGVPWSVHRGVLRSQSDVLKQSIGVFAGTHIALASGAIGAGEILANNNLVYGTAASLLAYYAIDQAYSAQLPEEPNELPVLPVSASRTALPA